MVNDICVPSGSRCEVDDECDINARCQYDYELEYSVCTCSRGFEGDGRVCKEVDACGDVICGPNEECVSNPDFAAGYECSCINGYKSKIFVLVFQLSLYILLQSKQTFSVNTDLNISEGKKNI